CTQCHNTTTWTGANFDHATTGFALTGVHATTQCAQCHVNGNYNLTSANTACVSCHLKDFQGATNPNHVSGGFPQTCQQCQSTTNPNHVQSNFPQTCQQCHTTTTWGNATFDHATTGFPLTGAHIALQCLQCHVNGNYGLTAANTTCISCHQNDFNTATNPPHA